MGGKGRKAGPASVPRASRRRMASVPTGRGGGQRPEDRAVAIARPGWQDRVNRALTTDLRRSGRTGAGMNHLYYGDNLKVLRDSIRDESVDLIYLDPPFNSNASYNVLFRSPTGDQSAAQIEAFDDTWHWNDSAGEAFGEVMRGGNAAASTMLQAMRSFLGDNDMMAYLTMMAVRLIELHRVLKPTGGHGPMWPFEQSSCFQR